MSNLEYECWFCGLGIDPADDSALVIGLWNLWNGTEDSPAQNIFVHFDCAETRMKGASMSLERDTFLLDEGES
jgi:hypothetical protein